MPYGIRARAKKSNAFVRAQTTCWLQSDDAVPDGYIQVIGLSSGRRMVSFRTPVAAMERFEAIHFSADSHERLGFPSLDQARELASQLNDGATTLPQGGHEMTKHIASPQLGEPPQPREARSASASP